MPPDAKRAGVQVKCSADGDTEVWMELDTQFQNGLEPCPLESEMSVHMAIQIDVDGACVTNFVNGIVKSEGGPKITFE
jgi:hypothetical protein